MNDLRLSKHHLMVLRSPPEQRAVVRRPFTVIVLGVTQPDGHM